MSVVLDCLNPAALVEFWCTALGYQAAGEVSSFVVLEPVEGQPPGPVFILQKVSDPKTAKNRMHVDIHPPLDGGVPALAHRLEALGGRPIGDPVTELLDELGIWWVTMADPEGNEFDLVADSGHPAP